MSHFTVLVTKTNEKDIERQLAPFDENREMPMHITTTREQFVEKGRKDVEYAQKKIAEYDKDPEAYKAGTTNEAHIKWLEGEARKVASTTDEDELFKIGAKFYLNDVDENGNYWSESNEDAKWDWYQTGGRWAGFFQVKDGAEGIRGENGVMGAHNSQGGVDVVRVGDIDWDKMDAIEREQRGKYWDEEMAKEDPDRRFVWADNRDEVVKMTREEYVGQPVSHCTFAVLHEGRWYERGEMGWWGMVSNEKETDKWEAEWRKLVDSLDPDTFVTVVDCHI